MERSSSGPHLGTGLLITLAVVALTASSCLQPSDPPAEDDGRQALVCDTDHLFDEVQWIIDNGWIKSQPASLRSVSAMPVPSYQFEGRDYIANGNDRLIGAYIYSGGAHHKRYFWYAYGDSDISTLNPDNMVMSLLLTDLGSLTREAFPRFATGDPYFYPIGLFKRTASVMSDCLGGEVDEVG